MISTRVGVSVRALVRALVLAVIVPVILALLLEPAVSSASVGAQRAPRWGGGGVGVSPAPAVSGQWTNGRIEFIGPLIIVSGPPMSSLHRVPSRSGGGSWDGTRPTHGGSPPARSRRHGADLSGFFGFVPPRGETAQNVPVHALHTLPRTVAREPQRTSPRAPPHDPPRVHHPRIIWPTPRP